MNQISIENQVKTSVPLQINGKQATQKQGGSFGEVLSGAIGETSRLRNAADIAVSNLASGKAVDIHQTMIAIEKASISFKLMMQVRNKVVEAYKEIMRTAV